VVVVVSVQTMLMALAMKIKHVMRARVLRAAFEKYGANIIA
jgi:hypothetical protein